MARQVNAAVAPVGYWPAALTVIYVMIATIAVRLHEFVPGAQFAKPVLTTSVLGAGILLARSHPNVVRSAFSHPMSRLVIAYLIWTAVTIPFALWPTFAFMTWRGLLPGILMFIAFFFCPPTRDTLQRAQIAFVVLVFAYAVYAQTFGQFFGGRLAAGGMYDANDMASLMAMSFPMAAGLAARSAPGRWRLLGVLITVSLAGAIVATSSRGGILALLAGALVFSLGFSVGRSMLIVLALTLLGIVAWNTATPEFRERMGTLTNLEQDYNTTDDSGRKAVWKRGRQYIRDNPFLGVGAGNFPIAEGGTLTDQGRTGKWNAAHNAYIQAFAELGVVGGSLFVGILLAAFVRAASIWRARTVPARSPPLHRPELLAALLSFCAAAVFLSHAYFLPAFTLFGLIALADRVRTAEAAGGTRATWTQPVRVRPVGQRGGLALGAVPVRRQGG